MFYTLRGSHLHCVPTMWVAFHFTHEQSLGFFFSASLKSFRTGSKLTSSPVKLLLATWLTTYIADRFPNGDDYSYSSVSEEKGDFLNGHWKPAVRIHSPVLRLDKKSEAIQCLQLSMIQVYSYLLTSYIYESLGKIFLKLERSSWKRLCLI